MTSSDVEVTDDQGQQRYLVARDGHELGFAAYERADGVTTFTHTIIEPSASGQGIGSALVRAALDAERAAGRTIVPRCPFVRSYVERHPQYADLTA